MPPPEETAALPVQLMAGKALHYEQGLAGGRVDGKCKPALGGRRLAHQLCHLKQSLLADANGLKR
jgi:hypothetical protein